MTLDDEQLTWREQALRDRAYYDEVEHQEWLVQQACESPEARETYWAHVFATDPQPDVHYDEPTSLHRSCRGPHD